jgi:predicted MPP superfamily phosphohydrolase
LAPSIAAICDDFLGDVGDMIGHIDKTPDVVVLTGDLAKKGQIGEFWLVNELLLRLRAVLAPPGTKAPRIFSVPGNHDVDRDAIADIYVRDIEQNWGCDGDVNLWDYRSADHAAAFNWSLDAYEIWSTDVPFEPLDDLHSGKVIGDATGTLHLGSGCKLGFLGLNTTIRHVSDRATCGSLTIRSEQISDAVGRDVRSWMADHDVVVMVTHHPMSWLERPANVAIAELLLSRSKSLDIHLCGHMHQLSHEVSNPGTAVQLSSLQGRSLFSFDQLPNGQHRSHGYQFIEFDDELEKYRTWPRQAMQTEQGTWIFSRDSSVIVSGSRRCSDWIALRRSEAKSSKKEGSARIGRPPSDVTTGESSGSLDLNGINDALSDIATGNTQLVIGADLYSSGGSSIGTQGLRRSAARILGLNPTSSDGPLIELLANAYAKSPNQANEAIQAAVDADRDGSRLRENVLKGPWAIVADLWFDAGRAPSTDSSRHVVATSTDAFSLEQRLVVLMLNGIAGSVSLIDTGPPNKLPSSSNRRRWIQHLSHKITRFPVIYLADDIDDLGLWQYLALRGMDASLDPLMPSGYLVCPSLPSWKEAKLKHLKVRWIGTSPLEFCRRYLMPSRQEIVRGRMRLSRNLDDGNRENIGQDQYNISSIRSRSSSGGDKDVLLGRQTEWPDVLGGQTIRFDHVAGLRDFAEGEDLRVGMLHGTAGCGKTTALMHLALELDSSGRQVFWLDRSLNRSISEIVGFIDSAEPEFVLVDNLDVFGLFGSRAPEIIERFARKAKVIAALRTRVLEQSELSGYPSHELEGLTSNDVWTLLEVLDRRGLLGSLRGLGESDRFKKVNEATSGQLLVALMSMTKGRAFADIIHDEYLELDGPEANIYAVACVVVSLNESGCSLDELEMATGAFGSSSRRAVESLTRSRILTRTVDGLISPRHRLIGEKVLEALAQKSELVDLLMGLVELLAASGAKTRDSARRDRRMLIRAINHDQLKHFGLSLGDARRLYESVQPDMKDDFHFWLQRGAYELEEGSGQLALNYLEQAQLVEGGSEDAYVLTELAIARLAAARSEMGKDASARLGEAAVSDLIRVVDRSGARSPHSVVILGTDGLAWLERSELGGRHREQILAEIERIIGGVVGNKVADLGGWQRLRIEQARRKLVALRRA